jgi:nitrogen regulatory protein A
MENNHIKSIDEHLSYQFRELINLIHSKIGCEFLGIALQEKNELDIGWPFVKGNNTEKYKWIKVRYGKGIAGKVISTDRSMQIIDFPNDIIGISTDYPIMLAEKLISAYAVPVRVDGVPKGALLVGCRHSHVFSKQDHEELKELARELEKLLPLYYSKEDSKK